MLKVINNAHSSNITQYSRNSEIQNTLQPRHYTSQLTSDCWTVNHPKIFRYLYKTNLAVVKCVFSWFKGCTVRIFLKAPRHFVLGTNTNAVYDGSTEMGEVAVKARLHAATFVEHHRCSWTSMEIGSTFYNIGEHWSTILNGRPHGFLLANMSRQKSTNVVQQKSHRVDGALATKLGKHRRDPHDTQQDNGKNTSEMWFCTDLFDL